MPTFWGGEVLNVSAMSDPGAVCRSTGHLTALRCSHWCWHGLMLVCRSRAGLALILHSQAGTQSEPGPPRSSHGKCCKSLESWQLTMREPSMSLSCTEVAGCSSFTPSQVVWNSVSALGGALAGSESVPAGPQALRQLLLL